MDETRLLKDDSFNIFCMMILPEILRASDDVSGLIFCKFLYIYIDFYMMFICFKWTMLFYEFYVSLNVYLQYTMFDLMS